MNLRSGHADVVTIDQVERGGSGPELGQECRFAVHGESLESVEFFLEHEGVFYPSPLHVEPDRINPA